MDIPRNTIWFPKLAAAIRVDQLEFWEKVIARAKQVQVQIIHLDLSDGKLFPYMPANWLRGCRILQSIRLNIRFPIEVHLMAVDVMPKLYALRRLGVDLVIVHAEAEHDIFSVVKHAKFENVSVGIAISPATAVESLLGFLKLVDLVLIMLVGPGEDEIGANDRNLMKVRFLRKYARFPGRIAIDGGVDWRVAVKFAREGVDTIVSGKHLCEFAGNFPFKLLRKNSLLDQ